MTIHFQPYNIIEQSFLEKIHQSSIKVLEKTGMVFHHPEVVRMLEKHGIKTDGQKVFFTEKDLEKALAACPKSFPMIARNPDNNLHIGKNMVLAPATGAVFLHEPGKGRRPGRLADFRKIQKLYHQSPLVDIAGYFPVDISDVDADKKHLHATYETLKHTDKVLVNHMHNAAATRRMLDMVEIAFDDPGIMDRHCVCGVGINPLSPLKYGTDACDTILEYTKHGQSLYIAPAAMIGLTCPVSIPGCAVQQNAEALAGIILVQLLNPGNPVVYGPSVLASNMREMVHSFASPDIFTANLICHQLGRTKYGLPLRTQAGTCDAKELDLQAGLETMQFMLMAFLGQVGFFHLACGLLDGGSSFSMEKMILDEEIYSRMLHYKKGMKEEDVDSCVDLIHEVGPGGEYITHEQTYLNFKELWQPFISSWDSLDKWDESEEKSIVDKAGKIICQRLSQFPENGFLSKEIDKKLQGIIE